MPRAEKTETFEQLYERLEQVVGRLEQGGLPLEESIALYEQGMTLAKQCQQRLDQAELKITRLRESFAALPGRTDLGGNEDDGFVPDHEDPLDGEEFP
jgi:exodeoxyribonuclease VII small subunit